MAYYNGKIQRNMLIDKIIQLLTTAPVGSAEPYWKKIGSGTFQNEGYILKSTGKSGVENILIRIRYTTATNYIQVTALEDYKPNDVAGLVGTMSGETSIANVYYHINGYNETFPVEYRLSFDRDKIILALTGDKTVNGNLYTGLLWIGMPQRVDSGDKSNGAVTIACSTQAHDIVSDSVSRYQDYNRCRVVRDRSNEANSLTHMRTLDLVRRSKGWGDIILMPTIYLEDYNGQEGVRSIMDGVFPVFHTPTNPDFKHGDEIVRNAKRYTILRVAYDGVDQHSLYNNSFPSSWMAIEHL